MLVIANGAPKSGSTWLFNILRELHPFSEPPPEFLLDVNNVNPEIRYDRLGELLESLDYKSEDFIIKNHFGEKPQRDLLLSFDGVFVFDIERDIRDMVVSGYYYKMKERPPEQRESFRRYYWTEGRFLADMVRNYHEMWSDAPNNRVMTVSYSRLKTDFASEVSRMAGFLGIPVSPDKINDVMQATSMEKLRAKYSDEGDIKFFRKGVIGDWVNHFSGQELKDIEAIESTGLEGLSFFRRNYGRIRKRLSVLGGA